MVLALDKERIAHCFRRSLDSYDAAATVQTDLARRLMEMLNTLPDSAFARVLEVGCCTGVLTELLCRGKKLNHLYLNDLVSQFEEVVLQRLPRQDTLQIHPSFGDIEELPLPAELDLVVSGAAFQWLSDLPSFIHRLGRELKSGSYLAFSLFGSGTLQEFSSLTSVQLHYHSDDEICELLQKDFIVSEHVQLSDTLFFPSVRDILRHIRDTGVGGVSEYRWSRGTLKLFEEEYSKQFGTDKGLPLSYVASCFMARRR